MHRKTTLLLVAIASLGGLLYGYDIGIISAALLYLGKCMQLTEEQTGWLASAVMLGALASSVAGGGLSDLMGRKKAMLVSAFLFVASVALIIFARDFWMLFAGRTLQGLSAGMIAVVVPVYMTENAPAKIRGVASTMFQQCITLGILVAMLVGWWYAKGVDSGIAAAAGDTKQILAIQDHAWRMMFASSAYPAIAFVAVALFVSESARWLFKHGKKDAARSVLSASRSEEDADLEMREMEEVGHRIAASAATGSDSILQKRYLLPLLFAIGLLAINQATGICAVFTFPAVMLNQAGLGESDAAQAGVWMALVNFGFTIPGVLLVDKLGRKNLLKIGTAIILLALGTGIFTYWKTEAKRLDVTKTLTEQIHEDALTVAVRNIAPSDAAVTQISVRYSVDGVEQPLLLVRSDASNPALEIKGKKLEILRAKFSAAPSEKEGRLVFACLLLYLAGFAFGPGVCLWLMSSELLPTRVRSMGMGLGVLCNAGVTIATTSLFLPIVGNYGYAAMWACWFVCTLAYFLFAAFILPETKGKTLEEIEAHFAGVATDDKTDLEEDAETQLIG